LLVLHYFPHCSFSKKPESAMYFPLISATLRPPHCDPLFLLRELGRHREYCALLESASHNLGNDYSFLALGAHDVVRVQNGEISGSRWVPDGKAADPISAFQGLIGPSAEGERLRMGYIGFLSYEAARYFEDIRLPADPDVPDALFFMPEILLRIDHRRREVEIVAHEGLHEDLAEVEQVVCASPLRDETPTVDRDALRRSLRLSTLEDISPLRRTGREDFCSAVREIKEGILAGETFQVVLSQELRMENDVPAELVYEHLRAMNPSPYLFYFQTPGRTLVGASPETLIRVEGRRMLYRPIAGTRRRTGDEAADRRMREELLRDEKERCEHQMLVDLGRNDVGKVGEIGSVALANPFHIETYAHVFHMVSDITARLRPDATPLDAVRAVFPAGTLTGAPKVRAMETIRRLERAPRGIYGGAFGYLDLSGNVDFAIVIRTMSFEDRHIRLRVGAGIVADSHPEQEDNECLHKARSSLAAVWLARQERDKLVGERRLNR
jgi:anthranilate synthase component I